MCMCMCVCVLAVHLPCYDIVVHMCDMRAIKYTKTAYVMLPDWHNDLREMMIQNYKIT